MPNTGTQQTPYTLAFTQDDVIPTKNEINTLRASKFNGDQNGEGLIVNLDLLEETRE